MRIRTDKSANYKSVFFNHKTVRMRLDQEKPITAPQHPEIEDVAINSKWHFGRFVTEENREELISKLSPNKNMWFLFSIDDNPNYEMQENLKQIAERYHLG